MKIKVLLDKDIKMPTKAHNTDAGYDIYCPDRIVVHSGSSVVVDSGVHMLIPDGYVGMVKSKSGLNVKDGILCEGVIDAGYTGSIVVKAYNNHPVAKIFEKGDKLTQIVILPIPDTELVEVDSLEDTQRGSNGFGSSGR